METPKPPVGCSCVLNLGIEQLSVQDVQSSEQIELKFKLVNQAIHFHGACASTENCTIKDKINELKDRIADYYFDPHNSLIAIPNQISCPIQPISLDSKETDKKRKNRNDQENDKYYEDILHLTTINTLKKLNSNGFIMEGFNSGDCLQAKLELGKQLRKDSQCKCKTSQICTCGKPKHPELNVHEEDVMDILEVEDISDDEIARYKIII